jgi:hypothetical protein
MSESSAVINGPAFPLNPNCSETSLMIGSRIVIAPSLPEMSQNNHLPSAAPGWLGEVLRHVRVARERAQTSWWIVN